MNLMESVLTAGTAIFISAVVSLCLCQLVRGAGRKGAVVLLVWAAFCGAACGFAVSHLNSAIADDDLVAIILLSVFHALWPLAAAIYFERRRALTLASNAAAIRSFLLDNFDFDEVESVTVQMLTNFKLPFAQRHQQSLIDLIIANIDFVGHAEVDTSVMAVLPIEPPMMETMAHYSRGPLYGVKYVIGRDDAFTFEPRAQSLW